MPDQDPTPVLMSFPSEPAGSLTFGPCCLSPSERLLERDGKPVRIGGRALDILIELASRPGEVVSKAELGDAGWPGMVVEEATLRFQIAELRRALGERAGDEGLIRTVAGRGYCFAAKVTRTSARVAALRPIFEDDAREPLVGRGDALSELARLLSRAVDGEPQIVFVTGEPGVGKTVLLGEFMRCAQTAGAACVVGHCLPGGAETDAYHSVLECLGQLAGIVGVRAFARLAWRLAPTWAIQLPELSAVRVPDPHREVSGATPGRMSRELHALLEALSETRLIVLAVENLHWMDRAGLDLLRTIANRKLKGKLLLVASLRSSGAAPSTGPAYLLSETLTLYRLATEISLWPLSEDDVAEYLRLLSGRPATPELSSVLYRQSGGNPLFMRSIFDYWATEGLLSQASTGWDFGRPLSGSDLKAPPSLAALIDGEIERQGPDVQQVLLAASISEGAFSAAIKQAATAVDEQRFEAICEELVRSTAFLLRADPITLPDGRRVQSYSFRHVIMRDVACDRLTGVKRAAAHAAVAARIEQIYGADLSPVAGPLSRHLMEAGDWVRAIPYLRLTARVALRRFSRREAAAALEQALAAAARLPADQRLCAEVEIKEELATIYASAQDFRALALCDEVVAEAAKAGRPEIVCRALLGKAIMLGFADLSASLTHFREALIQSDVIADPAEQAWMRSEAHAWCCYAAGGDRTHAEGCEAAIEELRRLSDPVALNAGLMNYTLVLFCCSRYLEAYETLVASMEVLDANAGDHRLELTLPQWLWRVGVPLCLLYGGRLEPAFDAFQSTVQAFRRNGEDSRAATVQFHAALGHILLQDFAGAEALVEAAARFSTTVDTAVMTLSAKHMEMTVRGLAACGLGRPDEALDCLSRAHEQALRRPIISNWLWRMVIAWGLADACLADGRLTGAGAHADEFRRLAYGTRERTWRALACETAARIALAANDLPTAEARLDEGWREVEIGAVPLVEWRLHAAAALLSERREDDAAAADHHRAWTKAVSALAGTLPDDHAARAALAAARPPAAV